MFSYKTKGTCSKRIDIDAENGVIRSVRFVGGCSGNLEGLSMLLPGMKIEDAVAKLEGIQCQNGTSCPDQLSKALALLLMQQRQGEKLSGAEGSAP